MWLKRQPLNKLTNLGNFDDISLGLDNTHWDSAGTLEFGARCAAEMLTAFPIDVDSIGYNNFFDPVKVDTFHFQITKL